MKAESVFEIRRDGTMRAVYNDEVVGELMFDRDGVVVERASDVVYRPDGWWAVLKNGTSLGPFRKRTAAIAAEVYHLNSRLAAGEDSDEEFFAPFGLLGEEEQKQEKRSDKTALGAACMLALTGAVLLALSLWAVAK